MVKVNLALWTRVLCSKIILHPASQHALARHCQNNLGTHFGYSQCPRRPERTQRNGMRRTSHTQDIHRPVGPRYCPALTQINKGITEVSSIHGGRHTIDTESWILRCSSSESVFCTTLVLIGDYLGLVPWKQILRYRFLNSSGDTLSTVWTARGLREQGREENSQSEAAVPSGVQPQPDVPGSSGAERAPLGLYDVGREAGLLLSCISQSLDLKVTEVFK